MDLQTINREPIKYVQGRQKYSLLEKQIIALIINQLPKVNHKSEIKPEELEDMVISFHRDKLSETNYKRLDEATTNIMKRIVEFKDEKNQRFKKVSMFPVVELDNGIISFEIQKNIVGQLLDIKSGYSEYFIKEYLRLNNSVYHVRFYEILSGYKNLIYKKFEPEDSELKAMLGMEPDAYHQKHSQFAKQIIASAVKALNENTSLTVRFERKKVRKGVYKTIFEVSQMGRIIANYPEWMKDPKHGQKREAFIKEPVKTEAAKLLCKEWGMYEEFIDDVVKNFECEIWLFNHQRKKDFPKMKNKAAVFCAWIGIKLNR